MARSEFGESSQQGAARNEIGNTSQNVNESFNNEDLTGKNSNENDTQIGNNNPSNNSSANTSSDPKGKRKIKREDEDDWSGVN